VLVVTMAGATFVLTVFGVLPNELIAEFGLSRAQLGLLGTASSITGAAVSFRLGRVVDRLGARVSAVATLALGGIALLAVSSAPGFGLLMVAAASSGLGQAGGNPSTNKLIALHVPAGRQGVTTGIKQSGVQAGTLLGGLLLPVGAATLGWRTTVALCAGVPLVTATVVRFLVPPDPAPAAGEAVRPGSTRFPRLIYQVALYGFLIGAGGSAIFAFLSLFAQETLGLSSIQGGRMVAVMGVAGLLARIGWGRVAEASFGTVVSLRVIAALALVAAGLLWGAPVWGEAAVWAAAGVTGASASAWNAVGMLAVIQQSDSRQAGGASGVVLTGFLAGLAVGAPLFGYAVDRLGAYRPGWLVVAAVFALAGLTMAGPLDHPRATVEPGRPSP
jgi:predicted MFS family arabinose efflux permease